MSGPTPVSTPSATALAPELAALGGLPDVLLPYQRELLRATASHQVVVCEKSRRIGATWGVAADAVLAAGADRRAGGMDVFYIGYNLDMTREFIDTCAMWARAFVSAAIDVREFLFREQHHGVDRDIQAFRITFASGFEIVALCSRPRSLRGRQGYVIIDEAAFHDELDELLKAALALLIWGGRVLVISTHDGAENAFNELVEECRAGKKPYALIRTTFDDALRDGLYRRVCLTTRKTWSAEGERAWADSIRSFYGDAASEELDCVPRASGGKYLPRALLEARTDAAIPVVRWSLPDDFVDKGDDARAVECRAWCDDQLGPLLAQLPRELRSFVGEDFGRSGDLTVLWPVLLMPDLKRHTPFLVELRNVPFRQQEQILFFLCDALPRFSGGALDARANGQYLAEVARQRYGPARIAEVMLSAPWYLAHMPRLKSALEDGTFDLPRDAEVVEDFRAIEVIRGIPCIGEGRTKGASGQRHGDAAVSAALAYFASMTLEGGPIDCVATVQSIATDAFGSDGDLARRDFGGWH
jgi:phage FluMu gp28-like protein